MSNRKQLITLLLAQKYKSGTILNDKMCGYNCNGNNDVGVWCQCQALMRDVADAWSV